MEIIKWDEKYSVGVDEIDRQHQHLFSFLNRFVGTFGTGNREEVEKVLKELSDYVGYHFDSEEHHYATHPDVKKHLSEHRKFRERVAKLQQDFRESPQDISVNVLNLLLVWLKNHILETDIRFFRDMAKRAKG